MRCCVSITAPTTTEARRRLLEGVRQTGLVELRLDGISQVRLERLLPLSQGAVIVTNRCRKEGGRFPGSEQERVALLSKAVALGADMVDLEIRTDPVFREALQTEALRRRRTRLILSYHDFQGTPEVTRLKKIFEEGSRAGADIVKIVTWAHQGEDNLKVLSLIPYARRRGKEIIAFCMGQEGKVSRILAPLLGAYLTYVSLSKGQESAPGQLTAREMKQLWRILKGGPERTSQKSSRAGRQKRGNQ